MARPTHATVLSSHQNWDAEIRANFNLVFTTPIPIPRYANSAALPAAADYEDCLAMTADTHKLYHSDGTSWLLVDNAAAGSAIADLSVSAVADPSDSPTTADSLRDDLVATTLADLATAHGEIESKINAILAALRDHGLIAT